MARKLYPIGIQTFERVRKEDNLYIDKTEYVYRMTHTDGKYFFLSRPRRFGSGTPTYLINMMRKYDFLPADLGETIEVGKKDFDAPTETMETADTIYVMELKFNKSAKEALDQIVTRRYAEAFAMSGKRVVKIGLNFEVKDGMNSLKWLVE